MRVSSTGQDLTFEMVRRLAVAVVVVFVVLGYLYGPAVSPAMHAAAVDQCNEHADGDFRSFRLTWKVGVYPHWTCANASRPTDSAVSLGWWNNPF